MHNSGDHLARSHGTSDLAAEPLSHSPARPVLGAKDRFSESKRPQRFSTLDGMRGVAAIIVAAYHFGQRPGGTLFAGYLAVDLFFALSGFVIALSYADKLASGLGTYRFFEMRLIRLLPLHMMGTLLGTTKQVIGAALNDPRAMYPGALVAAAGLNLFLLPDPLSEQLFPLNPPSWSLFFEMVVNVCFAAFIWNASTRVIIAIIVLSLVGLIYGVAPPLHFNSGWGWESFDFGLFRTVYSFLAGVLIFRHVAIGSRSGTWLSVLPIVAMTAAMVFPAPVEIRPAAELMIVGLGFPMLVAAGIRLEAPRKLGTLFGVLGDLSYPLYAIHWPLIAIAHPIITRFHLPPLAAAAGFLAFLLPAAYAAAKVDLSVRNRLSNWAHLRRTASPQAI